MCKIDYDEMNEEERKERLYEINLKLENIPMENEEVKRYYIFYKYDVRFLLDRIHELEKEE